MKAVQVLKTGVIYHTGEWMGLDIPLPVSDTTRKHKVDDIDATEGAVIICKGNTRMLLSAENIAILGSKEEMLG